MDNIKRKIYISGKGKKGSSVIDIELKETEKGWCFTASGLYNYQRGDYESGGQCLDSIAKDNPKNKEVQLINKLWKKYHLNDMNAGTPKQSEYLKTLGQYKNYDWACEQLEKVDLLYDKEFSPNNPYKYGSKWLFREIPKNDLELIKKIIMQTTLN